MNPARDNPTFSPQFSAVARAGISVAAARTWDPALARDPRLLVPVDVQALVVAAGSVTERAAVATTLFDATAARGPDGMPAARTPPPFTDLAPRAPGVYLHWAMPDGLTAGVAERSAGSAGGTGHRPLPNRWLVMRSSQGRPRTVRSWVLESERARAMPLEQWTERRDPAQPRDGIEPRQLTAVVGGDLAWVAVFDDVVNRFAFYDDLADRASLAPPLLYVVVGWYSDPTLDPLHLGQDLLTFDSLLRELGWDLRDSRLDAAVRERARRQKSVEVLQLDARAPLMAAAESTLPGRGPGAPAERVPVSRVAGKALENAAAVSIKPEPWWPRQSLFHGTLYGVDPAAGAATETRPAAADIKVTVGATEVESSAAMLASTLAAGSQRDLGERLQTAFGYGLLDALEQPDGVATLDEEVHRRGFISKSGGPAVEEKVQAGERFPPPAPPPGGGSTRPGGGQVFDFVVDGGDGRGPRGYNAVVSEYKRRTRPERVGRPVDPLRIETVRRAPPRWFYPADPVLSVWGLRRSLRHGYDGRFEPNERLACRLSGTHVRAYAGLISGSDPLAGSSLDHGGLPPEARDLLHEAVLEDPFAVADLAALAAERTGLPVERVRERLEAERRLLLRSQEPAPDSVQLLAASIKEGTEPSPVGINFWLQPWVPLYLEWELILTLVSEISDWQLDELDWSPPGTLAGAALPITGRSLLGPSAARALARAVSKFLEEEDRLDQAGQGRVTEASEDLLRALAAESKYADLLSASFEGLRQRLLGFDQDMAIVPQQATLSDPPPSRAPRLLRAGYARLTRLRVVDAFGRVLALPGAQLVNAILAESLRLPAAVTPAPAAPALLLPPRVLAPTRLLLRLVDGSGDADDLEATIDQSDPSRVRNPVAGWLLPDHVDHALEFFDLEGAPMGQLRHDALSSGVVWEGAPGRPVPLGAAPSESIPNRHVRALATAVVRRDATDRAAPGRERSESPLSALLRAIDTTLWTVDPLGQGGEEHLSLLVGRPIAVVRALLRLEVESDVSAHPSLSGTAREQREAAFQALSAARFTVRLGTLTRSDDGLLGYFVDDDYERFYPVHPSVITEANPSGPNEGYLGPAESTEAFHESLETNRRPINQPYLDEDSKVLIRPGQTVRLTLLLEPTAKIHVTSGIVPSKSISLLRDWVADALQRIMPSLRVGPVLVDPQAIRMPRATHLPKDQVWTRRSDPETWRDDPILAATHEALLPDTPAMAQEGYIRAELLRDDADES